MGPPSLPLHDQNAPPGASATGIATMLLWSNLRILTKDRLEAILQVFGTLEEATAHLNEEFLRGLGCKAETVRNVLTRLEEFDETKEVAELERRHIALLMLGDPRYPRRLREIADPPVFLYAQGDLSILDQPCLGLVGTRRMSHYGRRVAQEFVPAFVRAGAVTVSGLARGIDAEVASETIKAGGKTCAVLGHGLGMIYPKSNLELSELILEHGGLLLSEFPLMMEPETFTFPARNRIIAGASIATVVLEAPAASGAIITAKLALDYGREVFAVPGQIFDPQYEGCNALLASAQAKAAIRPADVLRDVGIVVSGESAAAPSYQPQNADEAALLKALTTMPQRVDELVERSALPPGAVNAALTMMELGGGVKNVGGGMWVKK